MTHDSRQRARMRALCDELCEDDGIDSRELFKPTRRRIKEHHKSKQLCRQVQKTLDLVLSGETGDDLLNSLRIVTIAPGADASRLLVTVAADVPPDQFDRRTIEERLAAVQGRLRCDVAAAINRRKTPVLTFQVLGPDQPAIGQNEEGQSASPPYGPRAASRIAGFDWRNDVPAGPGESNLL